MSADDEPRPDRDVLKVELDKAGFAEPDIERALEWLTDCPANSSAKLPKPPATVRVFSGQDCCGWIPMYAVT